MKLTDRHLRWSKFTLAIAVVAGLCAFGASQSMVVPQATVIQIAGAHYSVSFEQHVAGPVRSKKGIVLSPASATVTCAVGSADGRIVVSSQLQPKQQALAFIHETVHIAERCDNRKVAVDERIAQGIADLFDSPEGSFIVKELR